MKQLTSILKQILSGADPICSGPNKYGSLQLHIEAFKLSWAQVAEDKLNAPLPNNEAPSQQILCQISVTSYWYSKFTSGVLVQQQGAAVSNVVASCQDSLWLTRSKWLLGPILLQHICTQSILLNAPLLKSIFSKWQAKRKVFCIFSVPVLNFFGRWQPDSISYSNKKLLLGQRYADCLIHVLKNWLRPMVESCIVGARGLVHEQSLHLFWNSLITS